MAVGQVVCDCVWKHLWLYVCMCIACSLISHTSFLLTSSVPTYRVIISGDLSEAQRTFPELNDNETLSAGTICDIDVREHCVC